LIRQIDVLLREFSRDRRLTGLLVPDYRLETPIRRRRTFSVRNPYTYCEQLTIMSRSSTPWDDPDPDHRRTALPTDPTLDAADSPDVMASIDDSSSSRPELVIADVSRENAWVSVDETDATVLEEWC